MKNIEAARTADVMMSDEQAIEILARVTMGEHLKAICAEEHMPPYFVVSRILYDDSMATRDGVAPFRSAYAAALKAKMHGLADDLLQIADTAKDKDSALAAKTRLSARYFLLERVLPNDFAPAARTLDNSQSKKIAEGIVEALDCIASRRQARSLPAAEAPVLETEGNCETT